MRRPVVGIIGNSHRIENRFPVQAVGERNLRAVAEVSGAIPVMFASIPEITDVGGLFRLKTLASGLLAGQFLPLAFFPPAFGSFMEAQPFRYTLSFPLELLTGSLGPAAITRGFGWQIGYCVSLWAIYRTLWHYGLRSYEATGR